LTVIPTPNLQQLIEAVHADAASDDALDQLTQASRTTAALEELGDALLGHFVDQSRRSGRTWSQISTALGVTRQAVHKRFSVGAPKLERFTPRARAVLRGAADQARTLQSGYIGTEHLLLALFEPADGPAAQVLTEAGITRADCEKRLWLHHPRQGSPSTTGQLPSTPQMVEVLRSAVEEALRLGHNYIGTQDLLLALFSDPHDPAAKALTSLGASADDMRNRFIEKFAGLSKR
jgi:Clp amino terminal domain, pathogenicity island component